MYNLINENLYYIQENTLKHIKKVDGFYEASPNNPSLIINYNLKEESFGQIKKYIAQLWPKIHASVGYASHDKASIQNSLYTLCASSYYENYNTIYVHVFVDYTNLNFDCIIEFLKSVFDDSITYKFVIHAYFDMRHFQKNEFDTLFNEPFFSYKMIYQNKTQYGQLVIDEKETEIYRLMAHVLAIMIYSFKALQDPGTYVFSYSLLEKPTRWILKKVIKEVLNQCLMVCENQDVNTKDIERYYYKVVHQLVSKYDLNKHCLDYIIHNHVLKKVRGTYATYQADAMLRYCFEAMINGIETDMQQNQEYQNDISKINFDTLFDSYNFHHFLSTSFAVDYNFHPIQEKETLYEYLMMLGNEKIKKYINNDVQKKYQAELSKRIENAKMIKSQLIELKNDPLLLSEWEDEYYSHLVKKYFSNVANKERAIKILNQSTNRQSLMDNISYLLKLIFDSHFVFFETVENEFRVRTHKNISERDLFDNKKIYFYSQMFIGEYRLHAIKKTVVCINPQSTLKPNHLISFPMNYQDAIESIDFYEIVKEGEWDFESRIQ